MNSTGSYLGLQLGELWLCANVHLPAAAGEYASLANKATATTDGDHVFGREGSVPGAPSHVTTTVMGEIYPTWSLMRDQFQTLMARSAQHLYDTCDALMRVTEAYTDKDAENAEELGVAEALEALEALINGGDGYEGYRNDDDYADHVVEADDRVSIPDERAELDEKNYE
jgi:hypothetical protein